MKIDGAVAQAQNVEIPARFRAANLSSSSEFKVRGLHYAAFTHRTGLIVQYEPIPLTDSIAQNEVPAAIPPNWYLVLLFM